MTVGQRGLCQVVLGLAAAMIVGCTDHRIIEPHAVPGVDAVVAGIPIGWHGVPGATFDVGVQIG